LEYNSLLWQINLPFFIEQWYSKLCIKNYYNDQEHSQQVEKHGIMLVPLLQGIYQQCLRELWLSCLQQSLFLQGLQQQDDLPDMQDEWF